MAAHRFKPLLVLLGLLLVCPYTWSTKEKYEAREVSNKSQVGILRLRGFRAEVHYAITKDGYHLNLIRIVNPLIPSGVALKRPVLFNHGLLESSTIWLVNSRDVRPQRHDNFCWSLPIDANLAQNGSEFRNAALMLANSGYDVWLLSMRGTDWSLYHEVMDRSEPKFWDYSLDQFAQDDVPTSIEYIRRLTGAPKIGYVGHSQATFSIFGLLATQPHFADIVEPAVAVAPVAYFSNITSVARAAFLTLLDAPAHQGPVPESAKFMRQTLTRLCIQDKFFSALKPACRLVELLVGGLGKEAPSGYYSHLPFFTSFKVLRHFGQLIRSKQFTMYDHGLEENLARYGTPKAPLYDVSKIRSRSLVLIWTRTDALSHPKDVERFISELKVPLHRNIFIDRQFNHFDLITHEDASFHVNRPLLEILEQFEQRSGTCETSNFDERPAPVDYPKSAGQLQHQRPEPSGKHQHQGNSIDSKALFDLE